ncbi:MAG: redoxin domain-containing protein [Planctomycetota bacterium]|nr:redoxin domain-containing protein [Planctomycetota bacterium]MDA1178392.1 redoxin domain-containing protein [Planctomycetota bacterium]
MIELGELEKQHVEFTKRGVRVIVVSNDPVEMATMNQADFPHLIVVSDADQSMAKALGMIHPGAGEHRDDTNAPTILFVDGDGTVRDMAQPLRIINRLSPADVLATADKLWGAPQ